MSDLLNAIFIEKVSIDVIIYSKNVVIVKIRYKSWRVRVVNRPHAHVGVSENVVVKSYFNVLRYDSYFKLEQYWTVYVVDHTKFLNHVNI